VPAKFAFATKGTVQRVLLRMDWRESGNLEPDWRIDFFLSKLKKKKFIPFFCLSTATCQIWPGVNTEVGFLVPKFL
jgi:hypothetical protein